MLEHPAFTDAWPTFGLPVPPRDGGWLRCFCGGWVCYVEQARYGHAARKGTWLYAFGVPDLPRLRWGFSLTSSTAVVSWCRNHDKTTDDRRRIGKRKASATPIEFRDALLTMARGVDLAACARTSKRSPKAMPAWR